MEISGSGFRGEIYVVKARVTRLSGPARVGGLAFPM